jgi:putative photosynthetic complex assembly protein
MSQIAPDKTSEPNTGVPRGILFGAAALIGFALIAAGSARLSHIGTVQMPQRQAFETLSLRFEDQDNGGVAIRNVADGAVIYTVAPGTNGFIRATIRGLTRERLRSDMGSEMPFTLIRWNDGTMSLEDHATGRRVALEAFGPTNAQAFAQLFTAERRVQ